MAGWMCNIMSANGISADELRIRLKLKFNNIRTYLQNGRLQQLNIECKRMEESA